jgi:hypothetical protein
MLARMGRGPGIDGFTDRAKDVDCMLASPAEGWDAGGHPGRGLVFSTVAILGPAGVTVARANGKWGVTPGCNPAPGPTLRF